MSEPLDPLEMLLDAARHVEPDRPKWAKSAREAVKAYRDRAPTRPDREVVARIIAEQLGENYDKLVDEHLDPGFCKEDFRQCADALSQQLPTPSTAICAVSPPSPDTVREKDRADLAEKHLNQIYDYLGCCRSGSAVICTIKEREAALSSAPVAGAWQEVLKPFADLADAMYVSGHCGGASPEDWPDKWPISTTGGRDQHMPQSQGGVLTVADFRKLSRIYHSLSRNDRGSEAQ